MKRPRDNLVGLLFGEQANIFVFYSKMKKCRFNDTPEFIGEKYRSYDEYDPILNAVQVPKRKPL